MEMLRGLFSLCRSLGAGLDETRLLAKKHCDAAIAALEDFCDSKYKAALYRNV